MCLFNQVPVVQKVDGAIQCIVQLVLLIGFIRWIARSSFWTAGARTLRRWNRLTTGKMFLFFNQSISQYKIFCQWQLNPISLPAERSSIDLDDKKNVKSVSYPILLTLFFVKFTHFCFGISKGSLLFHFSLASFYIKKYIINLKAERLNYFLQNWYFFWCCSTR